MYKIANTFVSRVRWSDIRLR